MIRNLGQVAAIYIGSSAPRNTNLIWLDNTVVPFVFRAYDGSAWSEIATHKWVRAYVDGWLVTLPPRQLADDGDYMLINSNNVNYKITVKDFVKSAVGNPLDFKGVIRVSADFPNPSTLESGDMYVIITSPAGGTVTDPYSGKTFEDSEKIVWDEVTQSWESLGKINITVDLTTSYSETEVTIHSSAGKETTIQGATDQLAGVMLPGQYSWLQALSNGSIVPGDPSPLTPLTPAHKHNYSDIVNRLVSQQGTGESTTNPMSQKATTDALNLKFDKASVLQVSGAATDKVMSQKAVTDALKTLSDDFNNKLTNYLPLSGGTMTGSIIFPNRKGIFGRLTDGTSNIKIAVVNANNNVEIGNSNTPLMLVSNSTDLTHYRDNNTYKIWDKFNLPDPATSTDLANYLPLIGGTLTGQLTIKQSVDIKLRLQSTDADNYCIIQAINSQASQLGVFGYAGDKWAIGHNGTYYEIWDKYNLTNPVTYTTNTYNHATLTNKDGQYFTYIKAGTNGLLPHSKATLANGGSGSLGTSDQSFNAAYINHLYTNKISFGTNGAFIDNQSGDSSYIGIGFYTSQNAACPVYVGNLYVSDSYANSAPNMPTNGIYSKGNIYTSSGIAFKANIWTNDLAPNRNYGGYLQVLDAYNASSAGVPTNYGTVLQVNSRNAHWANQLWFPGGAKASKNGLYYRHMAYNQTEYGDWIKLATEFDLNSYLTKTEASTLYYPYNGRGYLSITSTGKPVMSNNQGYAVKDKDGNEREVLWMGTNNILNLGNTSQYTLGQLDLRCTTLTHNGNKIATQSWSNDTFAKTSHTHTVNQLSDLGTNWSTALTAAVYTRPLSINGTNYNCYAPGGVSSITLYGPTSAGTSGQILQSTGGVPEWVNASSVVGNFVSKSGDTMTGALTMNNRRENVVVDVVAGIGNNWNEGAGALSIQIPNGNGQTPLILARRSGAAINTTVATERLLDMALLDTGTIFRVGMSGVNALELEVTSFTNKVGIGKLFGKQIATTDQIPSIPSISISNSGSGNAVTAISASGHTLTVTKGATYLTSSSLDGYATQSWANGQFAPLKNYFVTSNYVSIATTGNEMCIGSLTSGNSIINVNYRNGTGTTSPSTWYWRAGSSSSWANAYWGNLYMNDNLVATQSWAAEKFPNKTGTGASGTWGISITGNAATATNSTQLGGTAASSYVKANDNISRLTNDSGYTTQEWVNSQNFVKSTSTRKVKDIQIVDSLPTTQASGVLYLVVK